jgi:hypothetical protein
MALPADSIRDKIRRGELKEFSFVLPLEIGIKADYLCRHLQCSYEELFDKLIMEEWTRQGEPVTGVAKKKSACATILKRPASKRARSRC